MQWVRRILEKIRKLRRSSTKVLVCPRCGSTRLSLSSKLDAWLTPRRYFCADCGYVGPIVMEVEEEDLKKRED